MIEVTLDPEVITTRGTLSAITTAAAARSPAARVFDPADWFTNAKEQAA